MEYKGKLYGKIGAKYFDTGRTSDDWDELEKFKEEYKSFDISILSKQKSSETQQLNKDRMIIDEGSYEKVYTIDKISQAVDVMLKDLHTKPERKKFLKETIMKTLKQL